MGKFELYTVYRQLQCALAVLEKQKLIKACGENGFSNGKKDMNIEKRDTFYSNKDNKKFNK